MQWGNILNAFFVNIAKGENVLKPVFTPVVKSARCMKASRILKRLKQHVPNWKVCEIVGVVFVLVMNAMGFWSLNDKSHPMRRV